MQQKRFAMQESDWFTDRCSYNKCRWKNESFGKSQRCSEGAKWSESTL